MIRRRRLIRRAWTAGLALALAVLVFSKIAPARAQPATAFLDFEISLRAASGSLTAGETTTPATKLSTFSTATIVLDVTTLTLADADDEVDFYIQTTYDAGANWVDVENVHFDNGDDGSTAKRILIVDGANDGPGAVLSVTGADPAANTEFSQTVPANAIWRPNSIRTTLVSDATVANRQAILVMTDGATEILRGPFISNQTASTTFFYTWDRQTVVSIGTSSAAHGTFGDIVLLGGFVISSATNGFQSGDNWGAPQFLVEAWHDPSISTDATMGDSLRSYDRPLGSQLRIKTAVTGATAPTYAYSASALLKAAQ